MEKGEIKMPNSKLEFLKMKHKKFCVLALILLLTASALFAGVSFVNAADLNSYAFLSVSPKTVGLN
jgi:hypothetical protein